MLIRLQALEMGILVLGKINKKKEVVVVLRIVCVVMAVLCVTGCGSKKPPELKSPCVSAESNQPDHPCVRRPANAAWLS